MIFILSQKACNLQTFFHRLVYADVFYNYGDLDGIQPAYMKPRTGRVTLIDNDRDGSYDVAFIQEYYNLVVNQVDGRYQEIIYDIQSGSKAPGKDYSRDVYIKDFRQVYIKDGSGGSVAYETIPEGAVLSVCRSLDQSVLFATVSEKSVFGYITEREQDKLRLDGKEYRISADARFSPEDLRMDFGYTFYLDAYGEIAYAAASSEYQLGYVLDGEKMPGVSNKIQLRFLDSYNTFVNMYLADSITVIKPAGSYKMKAAEVLTMLSPGGSFSRQLLYFATDKNEAVYKLIMPYTALTEQEYEAGKDYPFICCQYLMDSWPATLGGGGKVIYNTYIKGFANWLLFTNSTAVFNVTPLGKPVADEEVITSGGISDFIQYEQIAAGNLVPYKITGGDGVHIDALVRYTDVAVGVRINEDAWVSLVEQVVEAADPDTGDSTYKITMITNGREQAFYAEDADLFVKTGVTPEPGDLIKYSMGSGGKLDDLQMVYQRGSDIVSNSSDYWNAIFRCATGKVTKITGNVAERMITGYGHSERISLSGTIYVYEARTGKIHAGTMSEVFPGDTMVTYSRYAVNQLAVVYKE